MKNTQHSNKIFAEHWGFARIFMLFFIGCIVGTYYEQFIFLYQSGQWESRSGLIYGPYNPVYGLGIALFALVLGKHNDTRPWYKTFLYASILGGAAEYVMSYVSEFLFNGVSWDYSDKFLNIGGRTTVIYALFWGATGFLFMRFIYPLLSKWISYIPYNTGKVVLPILVVFMALNMLISYTALIRQNFRLRGYAPVTCVGEYYDKVYTDDFLYEIYPNMIHDPEEELNDWEEHVTDDSTIV